MIGSMVGEITGRIISPITSQFFPSNLFVNGENGFFLLSEISSMFTDAAGTMPVTASGDYIGKHLDLSGNGYHFTQGTSTARFQFFGNYYKLDLTDDVMSTTLPAIASGTVVVMTSKGAWFNNFSCVAGAFDWGLSSFTGGTSSLFSALKQAANDDREIARLVINRTLTANEKAQLLAWAKPRGCPGEITFGSDIVVNGSFASNLNSWEIINSAATWDAGRAKLFNASLAGAHAVNRFRQQVPTVAGKFYYATAQLTNTSLASLLSLQARVYGAVATAGTVLTTNNRLLNFPGGGKTGIAFEATGTDQISVLVDATTTGTLFAHVDNITCREIIFP